MQSRPIASQVILLVVLLGLGGHAAAQQPPPAASAATPPPPTVDQQARKELSQLKQSQQRLQQRLSQLNQAQTGQRQQVQGLAQRNQTLSRRIDELELQLATEAERHEREMERKLRIYGWLNVGVSSTVWHADLRDPQAGKAGNNLEGYLHDKSNVHVGDLNLVFEARPAEQWRTLVEARLTYDPDGIIRDYEVPGLIPYNRESTNVVGSTSVFAQYSWGGVVVERAWVEWAPRDYFKVLAGQFFTPYGIWNLDHGSPVLLTITPPLLMALQSFPTRQTGIKLHGSLFSGEERLDYALTLSNGRTAIANMDLDQHKALGGRVVLATSRLGELELGFSWYWGRYTDVKQVIDTTENTVAPILPRVEEQIVDQHDELGFGVDLQWRYRGLLLQAEVVHSTITYKDPYRPAMSDNPYLSFSLGQDLRPIADNQRLAAYWLAAYRLPWLDLRPYVKVDLLDANDNVTWDTGVSVSAGLNYRPTSNVVLKAEYSRIMFPENPTYPAELSYLQDVERDFSNVSAQVAVSF